MRDPPAALRATAAIVILVPAIVFPGACNRGESAGNTFFIPSFDSSGKSSGGIQVDLSNETLDASAIVDMHFPLMIATQTSEASGVTHEIRLNVTPDVNIFYISPDRIIVPAQSPAVAGDGPFITLVFLEGQSGSAPLVDWTVQTEQGERKFSGKTSASGFVISGVDSLPIRCTVCLAGTGGPTWASAADRGSARGQPGVSPTPENQTWDNA